MVTVTVRKPFYDRREKVDRNVGDTFSATEERAAQIDRTIPGFITYSEAAEDYSSMTVPQLRELCKERGIEVPRRASKATIVSLLEG